MIRRIEADHVRSTDRIVIRPGNTERRERITLLCSPCLGRVEIHLASGGVFRGPGTSRITVDREE